LDQASVASIENLQNSKDPIYVHGETGGKSFPHDFTGSDYKDIIVDYGLQPIEKRNWFTYGIRRCIKLELHDTSLVPETYNGRLSIPRLNFHCDI
jgi:hypothetical protein